MMCKQSFADKSFCCKKFAEIEIIVDIGKGD
jgi:hypothetical protein